jgi:hypothetical protein
MGTLNLLRYILGVLLRLRGEATTGSRGLCMWPSSFTSPLEKTAADEDSNAELPDFSVAFTRGLPVSCLGVAAMSPTAVSGIGRPPGQQLRSAGDSHCSAALFDLRSVLHVCSDTGRIVWERSFFVWCVRALCGSNCVWPEPCWPNKGSNEIRPTDWLRALHFM